MDRPYTTETMEHQLVVCLYVDSPQSVMVCDDFAINAGHLDSLFIEI